MRKYLKTFAFSYFFVAVLLILLNAVVDPHRFFQTKKFFDIGVSKRESTTHEYASTPVKLLLEQPTTLVVGKSRVRSGLNFRSAKSCDSAGAMSYGFRGAQNHELEKLIKFSIDNAPVRKIFLSLYFENFFAPINPIDRVPRRLDDWRFPAIVVSDKLLSFRITFDSVAAVIDKTKRKKRDESPKPGKTKAAAFYDRLTTKKNVTLSPKSFDILARIFGMAADNDVDLVIFNPPMHVSVYRAFIDRGIWPSYLDWLKIVAGLASRYGVEFWDFSLPRKGALENPTTGILEYFRDAIHFKWALGAEVLNTMCAQHELPGDILAGTVLTAENIDTYLSQLDFEVAAYWDSSPEVTKYFQSGRVD